MPVFVNAETWHEALVAVQADLEAARMLLADARSELEAAETRAKAAWRRRNAAADSRALTIRTARACGLLGTTSVVAAIQRCDGRVAAAMNEIHEIIESSKQTCAIFEWAWETYRNARVGEVHILGMCPAIEMTEPECPTVREERKAPGQARLDQALESQRSEEKLRHAELALPDDEHFDPQYDEVELLQRRMRPWV